MDGNISVYCSVCFAMPGEPCVEKYVAHGTDGVTPVISAAPHGTRIADSDRAQFSLSQKAPQ